LLERNYDFMFQLPHSAQGLLTKLLMSKHRILFFWEDDEDLIKMFSIFLREHEYYVDSVKSFDECIESCEGNAPILLVIQRFINDFGFINDLGDGLEFVRKIRSHPNISYFPIIVGWADFPQKDKKQGYGEAFEAGANACFGSVFDTTDVLEQIRLLHNNPMITGLADRQ